MKKKKPHSPILEKAADNIIAQIKRGNFWVNDYRDNLTKSKRVSSNTIRKLIVENIKLTGKTSTDELVEQLLPYVMRKYNGAVLSVPQSDEVDSVIEARKAERERQILGNRKNRIAEAALSREDINWIEEQNSKSLRMRYKVFPQGAVKMPPLRKKDRKSTPR